MNKVLFVAVPFQVLFILKSLRAISPPSITTQTSYEGSITGSFINCTGPERCIDHRIECDHSTSCSIFCLGQSSCKSSHIICPRNPSADCNILCAGGDDPCEDSKIDASQSKSLQLVGRVVSGGDDDSALQRAVIVCPSSSAANPNPLCNITGTGAQALQSAKINAVNTGNLLVTGYYGRVTISNTSIFCPLRSESNDPLLTSCSIRYVDPDNSRAVNGMQNLKIYQPNGLSGVYLSCETPRRTDCFDGGEEPTIFCGTDYSSVCTLSMTNPSDTIRDEYFCKSASGDEIQIECPIESTTAYEVTIKLTFSFESPDENNIPDTELEDLVGNTARKVLQNYTTQNELDVQRLTVDADVDLETDTVIIWVEIDTDDRETATEIQLYAESTDGKWERDFIQTLENDADGIITNVDDVNVTATVTSNVSPNEQIESGVWLSALVVSIVVFLIIGLGVFAYCCLRNKETSLKFMVESVNESNAPSVQNKTFEKAGSQSNIIEHDQTDATSVRQEEQEDHGQAGEATARGPVTKGELAGVDEAEFDAIKLWLQDTVELSEYFENFVSNGFEKMSFIQAIEEPDELEEIGIVDKGHQQRILSAVSDLKSTE